MTLHSNNILSDDEVVTDKSYTNFKIKGEAKKLASKIEDENKQLKEAIKLFLESKKKITIYQKRRQDILEERILPKLSEEFKMIHMLDQDKTTNLIKKKQYIRKLFNNKNDAIAFYKKHLHHMK